MINYHEKASGGRWVSRLALGAILALSVGCGTSEVKLPALTGPAAGPATFGLGLRITASPNILFADGQSTSTVTVTVSGPDGQAAAGRQVFVRTGDDTGRTAMIGTLSARTVVTDGNGQARVVFTAPAAKDFQATADMTVVASVVEENSETTRAPFVGIRLVAVDQRRWPEGAGAGVTCGFVIEPRWGPWFVGVPYRFSSRSIANGSVVEEEYIATYLWRFSDNDTRYYYTPDVYHTFKAPGDYIIFHSVLDKGGHVDSCNLEIPVEAAP